MKALDSLSLHMASFQRRGFRTDRPAARQVLEAAAVSFLTGYNLAAGSRNVEQLHERLAEVDQPQRGFAYEGAGMRTALVDLSRLGRSGLTERLATGPGAGFVHLVHVGAGWPLAPLRLPACPRLPRTPLLRWLALDGAGFGAAFFGGEPALGRICRSAGGLRRQLRIAGAGRALWFQQSADVDGVRRVIQAQPAHAAPDLWAGIGLACGYAGASDTAGRQALVEASGTHLAQLRQGVLFGTTARAVSGFVPEHTEQACHQLVGVPVSQAMAWAAAAAEGLRERTDVAAFDRWRRRLAQRAGSDRTASQVISAGEPA